MQGSARKPWFLAFTRIVLDMHHPPIHHSWPRTLPHSNGTFGGSGRQKLLLIGPRHWPGLQTSWIAIWSSIRRTCQNKYNPWRPNPATPRTQRINCQRHHRTTPEVQCPCLTGSEPSRIHSGALMDDTCSCTSHGCSMWLGYGTLGGQVDMSSSLSFVHCPAGRLLRWGVPLPWRDVLASAPVFEWMVQVKWQPYECQDPRFARGTFHCNEMINTQYISGFRIALSDWNNIWEKCVLWVFGLASVPSANILFDSLCNLCLLLLMTAIPEELNFKS